MSKSIITTSQRFSPDKLALVEKHYEAKYVCETCLKAADDKSWVNHSVSIFYQPDLTKVPEGGSQYFGLFYRAIDQFSLDPDAPTQLRIVNAISAVENDIQGIVAANGDVIYSRYRHDMRYSDDGTVWIDGGRDYVRSGIHPDVEDCWVTLRIVEGVLTIVEGG